MKLWQENQDLFIFLFAVIFTVLGYFLGSSCKKDELKHELFHAYEWEDRLNEKIHNLQNELSEIQSDFDQLVQTALRDSE